MAAAIFTDDGEKLALEVMMGLRTAADAYGTAGLELHLCTNTTDFPTADLVVVGDFHEPSSAGGYAPKLLALSSSVWTVLTASGTTTATANLVNTTFNANGDYSAPVTGYFVTTSVAGAGKKVIMYQSHGSSYQFKNGSVYELTLNIRLA